MNYQDQFKLLGEQFNRAGHDFISAALNYERKISGPHCSDIYLLRDSLWERLSSVLFHVELILDMQDHADHVVQNANMDIGLHLFVDRQQRHIQHVFDDIVFNFMSLFDYLASFAAYIFYGDQIRARAKGYNPLRMRSGEEKDYSHLRNVLESLGWRTVSELCNPTRSRNSMASLKGNPMRESWTAKKIVEWDKKLVSPLRSYRNDVIHNQTDSGGGGFSVNLGMPSRSKTTIRPPYRFRRDLNFGSSGDGQTILDAVFWLSQQAISAVRELLQAMEIDIEKRRQVPRGSEHMIWKGEIYPTEPKGA